MSEKKTLTLKSKRKTGTDKPTRRGKQRIIVNSAPATPKPAKKPVKHTKQPTQSKVKKTPPSVIKVQALDTLLHERFEAWRTYQPLKLGIEKELFRLISAEHLPYSKRVVRKLLRKQTHRRDYLQNVVNMRVRVSLENTISGEIADTERNYAQGKLTPTS